LFSTDKRVAAASTTLNVTLISVARARVKISCICGMAMRVRMLMSSITVITSTIAKPPRFALERWWVEGCSIERQQVEYARTGAHEEVERFDRRIRECHTPGSPQYAVIHVREPDVFHPPKNGTCIIERQRHAPGIDKVLLNLLSLEVHYQTEGRFLLLQGGRTGRGDPNDAGRPNPDPKRGGHGQAECNMP
jgi:hypothetical protein